jgi:hypothetical protein
MKSVIGCVDIPTTGNEGFTLFYLFFGGLGLKSGLCTCKAGALPLEPHLQTILLWLFCRWGWSHEFGLAFNHDPPDLNLPSV